MKTIRQWYRQDNRGGNIYVTGMRLCFPGKYPIGRVFDLEHSKLDFILPRVKNLIFPLKYD